MKKYIFIIAVLYYAVTYSQSNLFNADDELARMVSVPNSPEAQAFTKYGDLSVSLYAGTPNIQVPIHTIQGRELNLPIGLSYDASGVKVEQLATQVGLGWNLNVGGRISRVVNGFPDDFRNASPEYYTLWDDQVQQGMLSYIEENKYFDTEQDAKDYFYFLKDVSTNEYDTQPDYFSLNALGISDYIVFDVATRKPRVLNNPRIKVEVTQSSTKSITGWVVINDDGTKFHFKAAEETHYQRDIDPEQGEMPFGLVKDYNSSWLLTKIESPKKKDIFIFSYKNLGFWEQAQPASRIQTMVNNTNDRNPAADVYSYNYGNSSYHNSSYNIEQLVLADIEHNGNKVVSIDLKSREDIVDANSAIDKIYLHKKDDLESVYRTFTFNHSYFGNIDNSPVTSLNDEYIRLKLDNIQISAPETAEIKEFSFDYESPEQLPSRVSKSQDYLGYYNGADNEVLYPSVRIGNDFYEGANRRVDFDYAKIGLLTKMTYPTGGHTLFEYGAHVSPYNQIDAQANDVALVEETLGNASLAGGTDSSTPCNNYCQDQYANGPPKVQSVIFSIEEPGLYALEFKNIGANASSIFPIDAMVYLRKPLPPGEHPCDRLDSFTYDQVYNETGNLLVDPVWRINQATSTWNGEPSLYFESGCYEIFLVNPNPTRTISVRVSGMKLPDSADGVVGEGLIKRAGVRINSIKDFTAEGKLGSHKYYRYTKSLDANESSGRVVFQPHLSYTTLSQINVQPGAASSTVQSGINTIKMMNRISSVSLGSRPHIGYFNVFEFKIDTENNTSGYTRYDFYNAGGGPNSGSGIYTNGFPPYANYYITNHEVGKQKKVGYFKDDNTKIAETEYAYRDDLYYINKGIFINRNPGNTFKFPQIVYQASNSKYGYQFIDAILSCLEGEVDGIQLGSCNNQVIAQPCNEPGCISDLSLAVNTMQVTTAGGRIGQTIQVKKTNFFGDNTVLEQNDMFYDSTIDWLLREQKITNSEEDKTYSNKTFYPKDFADESEMDELINANRLAEPIQVQTFQKIGTGVEELMNTQKTSYQNISNSILPSTVSTAKGDDALETRITYHEYDDHNNPVEVSKSNGIHSVYIWGYDYQFPIAKIENATLVDIATYIPDLQLKSDDDHDNCRSIGCKEQLLRDELQKLREALPNAMVSTYTYDPLVGVTSMTDPKGYTMYYKYDTFNRLSYITDANDYVVKKYNYNYRGTIASGYDPFNLSLNNSSAVSGVARIFKANATGGSGNFQYEWFIDGQAVDTTTDSLTNIFTTVGDHTVTVIVKDLELILTKEIQKVVTVYAPLSDPKLTSNRTYSLSGNISFERNTVQGGSGSVTYEWYVNDEKKLWDGAGGVSPFFTKGTHTVKLRAVDNNINGYYKEVIKTVYVYDPLDTPILSSSLTHTVVGNTINFSAGNIYGGSGSRSIEWYVNDVKQSATGTNFSSSFVQGTHTIKLRVKDTKISGHYKERTKNVSIYKPLNTPGLSVDKTYIVEGNTITFTPSGIGGGSGKRNYAWYINGVKQSSTSGTSFSKNFSTNGTYTITFRVTDVPIATHFKEKSKTIYVYDSLLPGSIISGNPITVNTNNTFNINPSKGSGYYSYSWTVKSKWKTHTSSSKSFSLKMDYDYYNSVDLTCVIKDTRTGQTKTVTRNVNVNGATAPVSKFTTQNHNVNQYYQQYKLPAASYGGSGHYTYRWYIDGVYESSSTHVFIYLDCANKRDVIKLETKDTRTGLKTTHSKTFTTKSSCGGGGNGGNGGNPRNTQ